MLDENEVKLSSRHVLQEILANEMGMGISKDYREVFVHTPTKVSFYKTKARSRDRKEITGNSLSNSQNSVSDLCKCQGRGRTAGRSQTEG